MRSRYGPRRRLRRASEFDAVFKRGARLAGRLFLLIVAPNGLGRDRLGLAVSRKVGGSVARTRVRRLLRESFRRLASGERPGLDLVVVARPELAACGQAEVDRELARRLLKHRPPPPQPAGARPDPAR